MIENAVNKDMPQVTEEVTKTAPDVIVLSDDEQEYHFAGSGIYFPLTVKAKSIDEANAVWLSKRVSLKAE